MQRILWTKRSWLLILGLLVAGLALPGVWAVRNAPRTDYAWAQDAPAAEPAGIAGAESLSRLFRAAAKQVLPTVVKIRTAARPKVIEEEEIPFDNPFKGTPFEDFFDDEFHGFRIPRQLPGREGLGSGVIIDPKGVILTNNHVVAGADEVIVELADGRQFRATDIKTDEQTDLAVVRIKPDSPLPAAKLGDSNSLDIGDWVLAIGCPFELDLTVSAGIISGKGRALAAGRRTNFLQTDAAINPGNSGGPLVNLRGEVVGINTAIASRTGGYQGVGFAIPINVAKWVASQLIEKGKVERAYLGVVIGKMDAPLARKLGVESGKGVLVSEVMKGTPAAAAGVQVGDVIVAFAGQPVSTPRQLQELVERSPIGSTQRMDILRDGKPLSLSVKLEALPEDFELAAGPQGAPGMTRYHNKDLGLGVTELTGQLARQLGYEGLSGVVVSDVEPGSLAAAAGIREGMLILRVGKKPVKSVAEFRQALQGESLEEGILLLLRTEQGNRFVVLQRS